MSFLIFISKTISYLPILLIIIGIISNLSAFLIFRQMKTISSTVYLSFIVIIDMFTLFTWNLNIFLIPTFNFRIEDLSLFTCRFFSFIQYFSFESSALLLSIMSIDRYVSIAKMPGSILSKLPLASVKSSFIWSLLIIIFIGIINFPIFILNGYYELPVIANSTNKTTYKSNSRICYKHENIDFKTVYNSIQILIYCIIPGITMPTFNVLLILKTLKKDSKNFNVNFQRSIKNKHRLTMSLLTISFSFVLMTFPATTYYLFVYERINEWSFARLIGNILNVISISSHVSVFFSSFITNANFRRIVRNNFKEKNLCRTSTKYMVDS